VVLLADGRHAATGCRDGRLEVWRLSDGTTTRQVASHGVSIHRLARGPRGRLAAGSADGVVALFTPDGQLHRTLHGHRGRLRGVAFSKDGALLATAAEDTTLRLWSLATNRLLHTHTLTHPVTKLAFDADGRHLHGVTDGGLARRWQLGPRRRTLRAQPEGRSSVPPVLRRDGLRIAQDPKGVWTVQGHPSGTLTWYGRAAGKRVLAAVKGHLTAIAGVCLDTVGRTLYSVDSSGVRQAWVLAAKPRPHRQKPRSSAEALRAAQRDTGLTLEGFTLRPTTPTAAGKVHP
jgi:hypothetical protein